MTGIYDDQFVNRLQQGVLQLAPRWGAGAEASVRLLTLSENATFLLEQPDKEPLVIRVHRPDYHSRAEIASELNWIQTLRDNQVVTTPALIPLDDGSFIASFDDQGQTRYVVAFAFMPGTEPDADANLIPGFELLGATSARLHQQASAWTLPPAFQRKTWNFDSAFGAQPLWGDWRAAPGLTPAGQDTLERLCQRLQQRLANYGETPDRFGLVHADLRLANLLVNDKQLAVIDFDDCGFSWFMYDFAAAISFYETSPLVPELQQAWLRGYCSVQPLADEHIQMIPDFILFRRLLLTAWIASHPETETAAAAGHETYTQGTVELAQQWLNQQETNQ
ncbi:phosphotransferase enzyme family protein [Oceanobacter sp. 4_MG-2023]|uniref:phosphotransferase enzyme family protein n=1 Tax=Oceanobacter sp. 4_MG-2023 TaxID=3062623 RepID=UPI002735D10E|nr:phosphotransferase [Oceanobacter sp. 4_MG-2023]MDP2547329.1 phosphotransferase [Oceanobacter sp. 4_MG-2023]